jgi:hypothetical protein
MGVVVTRTQRATLATALAVAGGLISRGLSRWSGPGVFPAVTLWVICGVLLNQGLYGLGALGDLVRQARRHPGGITPTVPYGRPMAPASRCLAVLRTWGRTGLALEARRAFLLGLLAAALLVLLTQLYAPQVSLIIAVGGALLAVLALAGAAEGLQVALLSALAWCAATALDRPLALTHAVVALLAGAAIAAALRPAEGRAGRAATVICSLGLGLVPALNWQPALACPIWALSLAHLALPRDVVSPITYRLLAALSVLCAAVAVSYWL